MSTDQNTINSYSSYADQWAKHMRSGNNIAHEYLEKPAMYSRLPDLKGKKVLAIGCGTGEECAHIKSLGAQKVVGIDISEGLVDYARKSYPDIEFHLMNMEKIDLAEEFDFVYSSLVMHYVPSWKKALRSIGGVMKDNSVFLFSTHHPTTWGGLRTRTEQTRTSLLGYKEFYKTQKTEISGDYLNLHKIDDVWFGNFNVTYYHRPLEGIMSDILESDLEIIDFAEPKAIPATQKKDKVFYEVHEKIPLFMIFALRKKNSHK